MRLRFAIWEQGPVLYFDDAACRVLVEEWGTVSAAMCILVSTDSVKLHMTQGGHTLGNSSLIDLGGWPFRLVDKTGDYVARCGVFERYFWFATRPGACYFKAQLPLPHKLPWPKYHTGEEGNFDKHASAVREIRLRQTSLKVHEDNVRLALPKHVQELLTQKERVQYFQEFRI